MGGSLLWVSYGVCVVCCCLSEGWFCGVMRLFIVFFCLFLVGFFTFDVYLFFLDVVIFLSFCLSGVGFCWFVGFCFVVVREFWSFAWWVVIFFVFLGLLVVSVCVLWCFCCFEVGGGGIVLLCSFFCLVGGLWCVYGGIFFVLVVGC